MGIVVLPFVRAAVCEECAFGFETMKQSEQTVEVGRAWRRITPEVSLAEVHRSVVVPVTTSFWRKLFALCGPGFLVAVGYLDPGNWATDVAGGATFGYSLLMCMMSGNVMVVLVL